MKELLWNLAPVISHLNYIITDAEHLFYTEFVPFFRFMFLLEFIISRTILLFLSYLMLIVLCLAYLITFTFITFDIIHNIIYWKSSHVFFEIQFPKFPFRNKLLILGLQDKTALKNLSQSSAIPDQCYVISVDLNRTNRVIYKKRLREVFVCCRSLSGICSHDWDGL